MKVIVAGILASVLVFAQSEDELARNTLIEKLTKIYTWTASNDPSKTALTLRLADLLSERARIAANTEMGKGCTQCEAGKEDRQKALIYYKEALPKADADSVARVLTQIGHLYEILGRNSEAFEAYQRILSKPNNTRELIYEAHLSIAELYFKNRNYSQAKKHFEYVYSNVGRFSKGLAAYRLAWCDYDQGNVKEAIKMMLVILRSPQLLTRSANVDVKAIDSQFQEEVSRDLVVFLAHSGAGISEAKTVFELSPADKKLDHVFYLANEVERLGHKSNALAIWRYLSEQESRPLQRLEGVTNIAQIEISEGRYSEGLKDFDVATELWGEVCKEKLNNCDAVKLKLRNTLANWYVAAKNAPAREVFSASESYFKKFGMDWEMTYQLANLARVQSDWKNSFTYFQKALYLVAEKKIEASKIEIVLINQLEMSEVSKDESFLQKAIEDYLTKSPTKSKKLEVLYKKARLVYKSGNYEVAANQFRELALSRARGPRDLKEMAADLALDSLVILKRDKDLEVWSKEFASIYPHKAREYKSIAHKSILNQVAVLAENSSADAYQKILTIDVNETDNDARVTIYKNRLLLAEKNKNFNDANGAVNALLNQKLSAVEREFALSHKAYLSELAFDFKSALNAAKELPEKKEESKSLKLAVFAELANLDPYSYYSQFLENCKDTSQCKEIALKLVRKSKDPILEIQKQKRFFKNDPNLLIGLYVEFLAKNPNDSDIQRALKDKDTQSAPGRLTLLRKSLGREYLNDKDRIAKHKLNSSNRKIAQSIKERLNLLNGSEKLLKKAIATSDFVSQVLMLDLVAKESNRFYEDLLSLPLPEGLTPEEQQNYLGLLAQKANPHKVRATELSSKLSEFWNNEKAFIDLKVALENSSEEVKAFVAPELKLMMEIAPDDKKQILGKALETKGTIVNRDEPKVQEAWNLVRQDPMNLKKLEDLLRLERRGGATPMVAYLESRLEQIKKVQ